jgi:D-mannonate dehydratase
MPPANRTTVLAEIVKTVALTHESVCPPTPSSRCFATSERGKIAQAHFRNIRGHRDDFIETYIDEGDVNMLHIVRVLRDANWEGSLMPDHVPNSHDPDDPHKLQSFAFAFGYIQGMLRAAREEAVKAATT